MISILASLLMTIPSPAITAPAITAPAIAAPAIAAPPRLTQEPDRIAARTAWKYFERNWDQKTGLVNSVDDLPWTTLWDQGSAMLGIHSAHQLGLIGETRFNQRIETLLRTLETMPIPNTQLPNKAYDTQTAAMLNLDFSPDPSGKSGWSALDMSRFLLGLHVLQANYPKHQNRIHKIVDRWKISKLEKDGWLMGSVPEKGKLTLVQEGRLGYEQYAAESLKKWNINATKAINHPPQTQIEIDGITLNVDRRDFKNSGASNALTNDPYFLWALELGLPKAAQTQVTNLMKLQEQRFQRTGILTAVNEDSLDRAPYFLYYGVLTDGSLWQPVTAHGKVSNLRFVSTKAAFAWKALMPGSRYGDRLRQAAQPLFDPKRGYYSGRYENSQDGINEAMNVNTNAIILESLLYQARGNRPIAQLN